MAFSVGEIVQQSGIAVSSAFQRLSTTEAKISQHRVNVSKPTAVLSNTGCSSWSGCGKQSYGWSSSLLSPGFKLGVEKFEYVRYAEGPLVAVRAGPESAAPVKPSGRAKKLYPGEAKGFVEEMRFVAMKLHTKDQSKEGEKEDATVQPVTQWQPTVEGYIKFLVNSKKVYDTLEEIVETSANPAYAEFRNTGLERSAGLAKDLEWFESEGHEIPPVREEGSSYSELLKKLAEGDAPAFICHFYNVYFAHSAGGKFIGRKVAESILDGKELEFYKWDGDLQTMLTNVKVKLNEVSAGWTREEKNHCLEETKLSFKYSGKLLRLIVS